MTTPKIGRPLTPTRNTSPREMSRLSWSFWSVPSSLTSKKNSSQDPSFRYESTSQPKHDGVWTTFTINRYLFHIVRSLQGYQGPGIYLHFSSGREQFPGFYAQFRELNKAIGASGDGNLEYIYDNLMITEVNILYILYYILYICYILLYIIFNILHMSQSKIIP